MVKVDESNRMPNASALGRILTHHHGLIPSRPARFYRAALLLVNNKPDHILVIPRLRGESRLPWPECSQAPCERAQSCNRVHEAATLCLWFDIDLLKALVLRVNRRSVMRTVRL